MSVAREGGTPLWFPDNIELDYNPVQCIKGPELCASSPYMVPGEAVGRQQAILSPYIVLLFLQAQLEDAPNCNEGSSDDISGESCGILRVQA